MRIAVSLTTTSGTPLRLPIQYNYILQGFIYSNISDQNYRSFLHQEGYRIDNRPFKLFTYSRLEGAFFIDKTRQTIEFKSPLRLVVSSAVDQFITDLAQTLISADFLSIGPNSVQVDAITVQKDPVFKEQTQIKLISPMLTYSTDIEEGRKYTRYHSPWTPEFTRLAHDNLCRKYQLIHGTLPDPDRFSIHPNGSREQDFIRILKFKDTVIKAWAGIYWLSGNTELMKVAYHTGLGSKNSQGFGCFEVVG